jgi:hypothetical protein
MTKAAFGLVGVAALAVTALGVVQSGEEAAAQADAQNDTLTAPEAMAVSTVFGEAQDATDELPGFLLSGPQQIDGISAGSSRFLGEDDGTLAWAALNSRGEACLISLLPGDEQWASATCATPESFSAHGLGLQSSTAVESARLYFVPAGYEIPRGLQAAGTQLLVGNPRVTDSGSIELTKSEPGHSLRASNAPPIVELLPFESIEDQSE